MTGEVRVNPPELRLGSRGLEEAADTIPAPPEQFASPGGDDLSLALIQRTQQMEAALIAGLPDTKLQAKGTARDIGTAADIYEQTDQEIADQVNRRVAEFDSVYGPPKSAAGGGGAEQALSQFGQLAQMPMQMVQQVGQMPSQVMQQAGQVPQAVTQGVQQVSQMAGGLGGGTGGSDQQSQQAKDPGTAQKEAGSGDKDRDQPAQPEGAGSPAADGAAGAVAAPRAPVAEPAPTPAPTVDSSILL